MQENGKLHTKRHIPCQGISDAHRKVQVQNGKKQVAAVHWDWEQISKFKVIKASSVDG